MKPPLPTVRSALIPALLAAPALLQGGCQSAGTPTTGFVVHAEPGVGHPAGDGANLRARAGVPVPVPSGASMPEGILAPPAPGTARAQPTAGTAVAGRPMNKAHSPSDGPSLFASAPETVSLAAPAHEVSVEATHAAAPPPAAEVVSAGNGARNGARTRDTGFNLYGQFEGAEPAARPAPADGQLQRITFTTEGDDFDVAPAPDGKQLYFASTRHRPTADLYRQTIGGTAVTQLTDDPANDVMPAVSPDGRRIAFASDRSGTWDLYLMDESGGRAVKLTDDSAHNVHPSFSPDGKQIVYSSFSPHTAAWELVVIEVDRPARKKIIGRGLFPVWSPTDDTIAFQRARERGSRWFSVWTIQLENGEAVRPTEIAVSSNAAVITPRWSPDGERLVFCTVLDPAGEDPDQATLADVWVIHRDGSGRTRLTTGDAANLQPSWGPDGQVYFISDRGSAAGGVENIWSVRPGGEVAAAEPPSSMAGELQAGVPTGP